MTRHHARSFTFAIAVLATVGCGSRVLLDCEQSANCDLAAGGLCSDPGTGRGWCAYPDSSCTSGYRYSDIEVGDGVSGVCVAMQDGGMPDTPVAIDDWIRQFGSSNNESAQALAIAPNGDLVTTGRFEGVANVAGVLLRSAGDSDFWVARYAPDGRPLWSKAFGGLGVDFAVSVGVDGAGDIYLGGEFDGTVDFGGGPRVSSDTGGFFLKLRGSDGSYVWDRILGTSIRARAQVSSIAALDSSSVVVGGFLNGTVDFGGGPITRQSPGGSDAFVAAYDVTSGSLTWFRHLTATEYIGRLGGLVVSKGDVFVTGGFRGDARVGGTVLHSAGDEDFFVASYHGADGAHRWSTRDGGADYDSTNGPQNIAVIGSNVVVGGSFEGSSTIAGRTLTATVSDAFVASYNLANGSPNWVTQIGGVYADGFWSISTSQTKLAVGFQFQGSVTIAGQALTSPEGPSGTDLALARLAPDTGNPVTVAQFSGAKSLALGYSDEHLTGLASFLGATTFYGTPLMSEGDEDVAMFRINF